MKKLDRTVFLFGTCLQLASSACSSHDAALQSALQAKMKANGSEVILAECQDGGLKSTITVLGQEKTLGDGKELISVRVKVTKADAALEKALRKPVAVKSIVVFQQEHPFQKGVIDGVIVNIELKDGSLVGLSQESNFPHYWNGVHVNLPGEKSSADVRTFGASSEGLLVKKQVQGCTFPVSDLTERYKTQVRIERNIESMNRNAKVVRWGKED